MEEDRAEEIFGISSLSRIRWLSPNFSRIIFELGYRVETLQSAKPEILVKEIDLLNKHKKYYKGKIGERDVKRIISESRYVV